MAKIELYVDWNGPVVNCHCHPLRKCERKNECEYMEITINPYEGWNECMDGEHTYKKVKGRIRQDR